MINGIYILTTTLLIGVLASNQLFLKLDDETKESNDAPKAGFGSLSDWKFHLDRNERPVIGVFSQTIVEADYNDPKFANKTSYIMSAYTKFI